MTSEELLGVLLPPALVVISCGILAALFRWWLRREERSFELRVAAHKRALLDAADIYYEKTKREE